MSIRPLNTFATVVIQYYLLVAECQMTTYTTYTTSTV